MKNRIQICFSVCFLWMTTLVFSQTDTTSLHGTIKVVKQKEGEIFIKAISNYTKYDVSKIAERIPTNEYYPPIPMMDNKASSFDYTAYFINNFKTTFIDLKGKTADTVVIEIIVLANGKAYLKDKSKVMMVNGVPAIYNENEGGYELNNLHLNCLSFLKNIKKWMPAYVVYPKKGKFKGETVLRPIKKNVTVTGTITILFSTVPFD
jgi:hypothetical protein